MIGRFLSLYLLISPLLLYSLDLSNDRYWHTLLHFRDGESEIDDPNFFLSKNGKQNSKDELNATIKALKTGEINCRFPARVNWLVQKLPELTKDYKCQQLENIIQEYNPNNIYLIFPTAHLNSPASMYGHTFLRIDSDDNTPLISEAINYAAMTNENNGLLYAYYGLMGGYKGRYSISPYYDKIKEYNDMERRDIWEYKLNLNRDEIRRLLLHQHELKDIYSDYFFFTENCSYNLLWLLEAAKPTVKLTEKFKFKAIPIDTLRSIDNIGLLGKSKFRPSKSKNMIEIRKKIKNAQVGSLEKKVYSLDFQIEELRFKRAKGKLEKKEYVSDLMKLLHSRSKFYMKSGYVVQKPIDPLLGHKTNRLSFGFSDGDEITLSFKPSFHDELDLDKGFSTGSYINFFNLELTKNHTQAVKLEKFDIVDISSYASRDDYFKPLSWRAYLGFNRDNKDKLQFSMSGGVGYSYDINGFLYYFMLNSTLFLGDKLTLLIDPKVGVLKNYNNFKFGISVDKVIDINTFLTYQVQKDIALNIKYDITDSKKRASVSLFYYF